MSDVKVARSKGAHTPALEPMLRIESGENRQYLVMPKGKQYSHRRDKKQNR